MTRERIFCKWKERFFILTASHLLCFKKAPTMVMDMGSLVFKVISSACSMFGGVKQCSFIE